MSKGFKLTERAKRARKRLNFDDAGDRALMRTCPVVVFDDRVFGLHGIKSPCLPPGDNIVRSRADIRRMEKQYNIVNSSQDEAIRNFRA